MLSREEVKGELNRRRAVYRLCRGSGLRAAALGAWDEALFWFFAAAEVGSQFHFGEWADPKIDRALERIAAALAPRDAKRAARPARDASGPGRGVAQGERPVERLAHLTSYMLDGGGHAEIIITWAGLVEGWGGVWQQLFSSEWADSHTYGPNMLRDFSRAVPTEPRLCPAGLTPSQRVVWLHERLAEARPDAVILHVTPNDVCSVCAALMLRRTTGAQLFYFNQADGLFNLGLPLADRVIEHRPEGARYTVWRRGVAPRRVRLVPLGSRPRASAPVSRAELGVPDDATVSLTVASYYKLAPDGHWNFGAAVRELLTSEPRHHHLMVGHGPESVREAIMNGFGPGEADAAARLHWLGRRTDVDALLGASDFLIESFPLAGGTLRTDAMRAGAAVVSVSNRRWPLITETGSFGDDYPLVATADAEVVRHSRALINDAALRARCARQLAERYESHFSEAAISRALRDALLSPGGAAGAASSAADFGARPEYDLDYAVALGGRRVELESMLEWAELRLGYAHPPSLGERLWRLRRRARESLRYRRGRVRDFLAGQS